MFFVHSLPKCFIVKTMFLLKTTLVHWSPGSAPARRASRRRINGYGGGELGYDDRGWHPWGFGCGGSCIHLGKCRDAMDIERTHRRCTFVASLDLRALRR